MTADPPDSILVIKLGALGDVFLALDSFQAIRLRHPRARLHLLTRRPFAGLCRGMPWFDEVIEDPAPSLRRPASLLAFRRELRKRKFSLVYDLQGNDRARLYHRLLAPGRPPVVRSPKSLPGLSVPEKHRQTLERASVPTAGAADLEWLFEPLDGLDLPPRFVLLIPGCAPQHPAKRWPARHFAALAAALQSRGLACVAVGTEVDRAAIEEIRALHPPLVDLCGRTSIRQLATLARSSVAVVGNDTGPIHIAAITGAPVLVLMSRVTDPVRMLPHGPDVSWLKRDSLDELPPDAALESLKPKLPGTP